MVEEFNVINYELLVNAEAAYQNLLDDDVINVIDLINQIGVVENSEASKTKIDSARNAYDALSAIDQSQVINYYLLVKAENTYETLIKKENSIRAIVNKVIEAIKEIGTVDYYSDYSSSNIDEARSAYNSLPQNRINAVNNYGVLVQAEADYYAQYFTASIKDIYSVENKCDGNEEELTSRWVSLRESWNNLVAETKAKLKSNDSSESIEEFNNQYTTIVSRYTALALFNGGPDASPELKTIALSGNYKTEFNQGDEFNYEGLVVTATYYDNKSKSVTGYTVTGYNKEKAGEQTITVTYTENNVTKTATYKITVKQAETPTESKGLSTGAIVGIAVGSTALVAAIAVGVWFFIKKRY